MNMSRELADEDFLIWVALICLIVDVRNELNVEMVAKLMLELQILNDIESLLISCLPLIYILDD